MLNLVRIKRYKTRKTGKGGSAITIPEVYMDDVRLNHGDSLDMYRAGRLIILAPAGIDVTKELSGGAA